jgi:lipoprotein-anchoring transpeptidase ErfK/SrfK
MVWDGKYLTGIFMVASAVLCAVPSHASEIKFKKQYFEVLGGMNGSEDYAVASRDTGNFDGGVSSTDSRISKQIVPFTRNLAPGSVLIKTGERKLYFVLPGGQALQYPVGVGRQGYTWSGRNSVSRKAEWPDWRPPPVMIKREAKKGKFLPEMMVGGPKNPLGARALYIGSTEYRIHGTTQPWSIGRAVSSGCIRMLNEHVIDLYDRVGVGATVVVER